MTDKEKIEKLQAMLAEAKALMDAAAQFAGENKIPLKYVDEYYDPEEHEEEDEESEEDWNDWDEYGPRMRFGGQGFELRKGYGENAKYRWYNSNC